MRCKRHDSRTWIGTKHTESTTYTVASYGGDMGNRYLLAFSFTLSP